jgi:tetratricopeptide (TPR) repeat protein
MGRESMGPNLQVNRSRRILEIVRGLLLSEAVFQEILKRYGVGRIRFSNIEQWIDDKGRSLLYNLKEESHSLFREKPKGRVHRNEWLLDLVIGSIFHEAMKLRENIYQLEIYRPKYLQYKRRAGKTDYEKDYIEQFQRIISRAEQGVADAMEETRSLYRDAVAQLADLFKEHAGDPFWVRFLLEQQTLLKKVYGPNRTWEIFRRLFGKDLLKAYHIAGRSYFRSGHYDLASFYFLKGLKLDPDHNDILLLFNLSRGMSAYYLNDYSRALSYFGRLLSLHWSSKETKEALSSVEEVCRKISSEMKEGRGLRGAKRADSLADRIRKML